MRLILKMLFGIAAVTTMGVILSPTPIIVPQAYAAIPEPSSMALMAAGLGLAAVYRKVRKHK